MRWLAILAIIAVALQSCEGAKILFLSPVCIRSQKNIYSGVVNALADNGHDVTMVSPFKPSKSRPHVREIPLENDFTKHFPNLFTSNSMSAPVNIMFQVHNFCADALEHPKMQALLKEEFDVVLISMSFSECLLSVPYQLKVPFIFVSPASVLLPLFGGGGNPSFPAMVGSPLLDYGYPLTFAQRALSTLLNSFFMLTIEFMVLPNMESECRKRGLCPAEMPSLPELKKNVSLVLVNGVKEIESPVRPAVPGMIYCGGVHCGKPRPLPQDLEEWVAGAGEEGFIFFSLGSAVKPSSMPEEYRKVLVEAFGSLKQRVLWKWDQDTMDDLPPNVRLGKWLPQQDILGHPRLRLFITHGGMLSTQESMYHGVPVVGLPVFGDQMNNMNQIRREGWGRVLSFKSLTAQTLRDTVISSMTDQSLRKEAQRRSRIMRDQPMQPSDVVNFWVEYVIRHEGAPHLHSPAGDMPWYQLYNTDVWMTVSTLLIVVIYILVRLILAVFSCIFSFSSKKTKKD